MTSETASLRDVFAKDGFARALGIEFVDAGPGHAVLEMTVGDGHLNFLDGGHGGAIFALADMAFGIASNSRGTVAIGIDAHIAYTRGVGRGDRLRAVAEEVSRSNRLAVYRVNVEHDGKGVATFTGTVFVTDRRLAPP